MEEASHNRFSTQHSCSASGAAASQATLWGCLSHASLCWEPGWPGEVRDAEGKGGRRSDAGAEASLTLFPAAASAISIYSPAASPPGHSAAAVAGFQGCSVIKHPCLLQLPHFASPCSDRCWVGHGRGAGDQHQTWWLLRRAAPQQWQEDYRMLGMVPGPCSLCPLAVRVLWA